MTAEAVRAHRIMTTFEESFVSPGARQFNRCQDCGASTEGGVLPALPCPGPRTVVPLREDHFTLTEADAAAYERYRGGAEVYDNDVPTRGDLLDDEYDR